MSDDTWNRVRAEIEQARTAPAASEALSRLRAARDIIDGLINETMAEALVQGEGSIRAVAGMAGFSENAVGPRLARSAALAPYAREDGRVTSAEVHRAQYDYRNPDAARSPMKFVKRVSKRDSAKDSTNKGSTKRREDS